MFSDGVFQGEDTFHVFCFTFPENSWRNLCARNNAFLFPQVANSNKNNLPGFSWLFETKFNTKQLQHKGGICWLVTEMTEMAGMLGSTTSLPFPHLLVSACLYSLWLQSCPHPGVHCRREPPAPILSALGWKRNAGLFSAGTRNCWKVFDWPHFDHK